MTSEPRVAIERMQSFAGPGAVRLEAESFRSLLLQSIVTVALVCVVIAAWIWWSEGSARSSEIAGEFALLGPIGLLGGFLAVLAGLVVWAALERGPWGAVSFSETEIVLTARSGERTQRVAWRNVRRVQWLWGRIAFRLVIDVDGLAKPVRIGSPPFAYEKLDAIYSGLPESLRG